MKLFFFGVDEGVTLLIVDLLFVFLTELTECEQLNNVAGELFTSALTTTVDVYTFKIRCMDGDLPLEEICFAGGVGDNEFAKYSE
jgi:hypothetical protein